MLSPSGVERREFLFIEFIVKATLLLLKNKVSFLIVTENGTPERVGTLLNSKTLCITAWNRKPISQS
jgi:hypothetical protein